MAGASATEGSPEKAMPDWADWAGEHRLGPYSLGVEEEVMLVEPGSWELTNRAEDVLFGHGSSSPTSWPRARRTRELGCEAELALVGELSRRKRVTHQLAIARRVGELPRVLETLADEFCA